MLLQIPKDAEKPLEEFIGLPQDKASSFAAALTQTQPSLYIGDLAASIAKKTGIPQEQAAEFLWAFAGMHIGRINAQKGLPEFVEDICQALLDNKENNNLHPPDLKSFKANLTSILSADKTLGVTAKAIDVMSEHERVFQNVRVVTDMRPIFASDVHEQPSATVIVHMLNVFYRDLGEMKQICFALDANDLKQLKQTIERAEAKENTLKAMLKSTGLICLESK